MAEYRFLRAWKEDELEQRLKALGSLEKNFDLDHASMTESLGWRRQYSLGMVAHERPGPPEPDGPFVRLSTALINYEFSDPRIVIAHFDPAAPLLGRRMLLELRILGLRYLAGAVVAAVRDDRSQEDDHFGFRYETLEGHIESGWEWFLLRKDRATGLIQFSIEARWKEGSFPNFWSRLGFWLFARRKQKEWHRNAHRRMTLLSRYPLEELQLRSGQLAHEGPEIIFDFR